MSLPTKTDPTVASPENPIPDLSALSPPNLSGYNYFDVVKTSPFKPLQVGFDAVNATWLADAALLAYAQPDFAWPWFTGAGLAKGIFLSGVSTQVYVAVADAFVITAFRGTEVRDPIDFAVDMILANADFVLAPWPNGGNVHRGFRDALGEVWSELQPFLDGLRNGPGGPRSFWFTGHSLGAALATLATAQFGTAQGLYTYASPRVGDITFAVRFPFDQTQRFVNDNDAIPRLPPPGMGYKHVGNPWFINAGGQVLPGSGYLDLPGDTLFGTSIDVVDALKLNLFDHAPIHYVIDMWNNYAMTQK